MNAAGPDAGDAGRGRENGARAGGHPTFDPTSALALLVTYPARLWLASLTRSHLHYTHAARIHYLEPRDDRHGPPAEPAQPDRSKAKNSGRSSSRSPHP